MAEKLNISIYTINKLEHGIAPKRLGIQIVLDIYKEFGVKPSDMFK